MNRHSNEVFVICKMEVAILKERIAVTERHFRIACEQIVHLKYRQMGLERRYTKAKQEERRSFRYSLRLRIAVLDGLREVYFEYASLKAKESAELKNIVQKLMAQ